MYFNLWSRDFLKKSYINDINKELILFYKTIQNNKAFSLLITELEILEDKFNKSKNAMFYFLHGETIQSVVKTK